MPTYGVHFSDDDAPAVETAVKASPEKKPGPYIAEAVRQRMAREGMLPGNPHAELVAAAEEVGIESAIETLRRFAARKARAA